MTTTTQLPAGRYRVTGPAIWGSSTTNPCRGFGTGDIVELLYPATPDGDGDVQVRPADGPQLYVRASSLTPESEAPATPAPVLPVVGGKIRFTQTYVQGAEVNIGDEVEITSVDDNYISTTTTRGTGNWCFSLDRGGFEILPNATDEHKADIAKISAKLLEQATFRSWGPEYDQLVETVNATLAVKLPERERPFLVEIGGDFGRVTVTARNLDEAKAKVRASLAALR